MSINVVGIAKIRIMKNLICPANIQLPNHSVEFAPKESSVGRTLLHINLEIQPARKTCDCNHCSFHTKVFKSGNWMHLQATYFYD